MMIYGYFSSPVFYGLEKNRQVSLEIFAFFRDPSKTFAMVRFVTSALFAASIPIVSALVGTTACNANNCLRAVRTIDCGLYLGKLEACKSQIARKEYFKGHTWIPK
jgi:hypothetical protein